MFCFPDQKKRNNKPKKPSHSKTNQNQNPNTPKNINHKKPETRQNEVWLCILLVFMSELWHKIGNNTDISMESVMDIPYHSGKGEKRTGLHLHKVYDSWMYYLRSSSLFLLYGLKKKKKKNSIDLEGNMHTNFWYLNATLVNKFGKKFGCALWLLFSFLFPCGLYLHNFITGLGIQHTSNLT